MTLGVLTFPAFAFTALAAFTALTVGAVAIAASATAAESAIAIVSIEILATLLQSFDCGLLTAFAGRFRGFRFRHTFFFAFIVNFGGEAVLRRRRCRLHGAQHAEIVLGVLEIVFRHHAVAR